MAFDDRIYFPKKIKKTKEVKPKEVKTKGERFRESTPLRTGFIEKGEPKAFDIPTSILREYLKSPEDFKGSAPEYLRELKKQSQKLIEEKESAEQLRTKALVELPSQLQDLSVKFKQSLLEQAPAIRALMAIPPAPPVPPPIPQTPKIILGPPPPPVVPGAPMQPPVTYPLLQTLFQPGTGSTPELKKLFDNNSMTKTNLQKLDALSSQELDDLITAKRADLDPAFVEKLESVVQAKQIGGRGLVRKGRGRPKGGSLASLIKQGKRAFEVGSEIYKVGSSGKDLYKKLTGGELIEPKMKKGPAMKENKITPEREQQLKSLNRRSKEIKDILAGENVKAHMKKYKSLLKMINMKKHLGATSLKKLKNYENLSKLGLLKGGGLEMVTRSQVANDLSQNKNLRHYVLSQLQDGVEYDRRFIDSIITRWHSRNRIDHPHQYPNNKYDPNIPDE